LDARNHQLEAELEALTATLTTIGQQRKAALTAQGEARRTAGDSADADATLRARPPSAKPFGSFGSRVSRAARGAVRRIVGAPHGALGCHGVPPFL
jgi:hypothetical protein